MTQPPLDGITVISLEHAIAAPFCTRQLADLGARVIKIERPGAGDFARAYDQRVNGEASHFVWVNRSKESLTLDLKQPEALQVLQDLLKDADVLVQNLAPGAAARMGLGYDSLKDSHPRLIVCDISGYGDDGPYRDKKAYDLLIQSEAGFLSVTGTPDDPCKAGNSVADIAAGMYAYSSVMLGLQNEREWKVFCAVVLRDAALAADPRFDSNARRNEHREALKAIILTAFGALSSAEVLARLDEAQIANARMNDMAGLWAHPQLQARERWREVDSPAGTIPALLPPGRHSSFDYRMEAVPAVGQHTEAILHSLGRNQADVAALRERGAI